MEYHQTLGVGRVEYVLAAPPLKSPLVEDPLVARPLEQNDLQLFGSYACSEEWYDQGNSIVVASLQHSRINLEISSYPRNERS